MKLKDRKTIEDLLFNRTAEEKKYYSRFRADKVDSKTLHTLCCTYMPADAYACLTDILHWNSVADSYWKAEGMDGGRVIEHVYNVVTAEGMPNMFAFYIRALDMYVDGVFSADPDSIGNME